MVAGDDKLKRPGESFAEPSTRLEGARGRMDDPTRSALEPRLKLARILTQIMQKASGEAPIARPRFR